MHYSVKAFNTATEATNKIHDDAVARDLGFRGGLVPGVDVHAYLCHLPAERWGRDWLERGTIEARFLAPVYDGDEIEISGAQGADDGLDLVLRDPSGSVCAEARATLPATAPTCPSVEDWPAGEPPEDRQPATPETLAARPFGQLVARFHADRATEYLVDVREGLPLFWAEGLAHPGWLLRFANYVLTANVTVGPWIHVGSSVQLLGAVGDGDRVETRALVTATYERKGHRFVELDVLQVVDGRAVARTAHTAIYRPRGT